MKQFCQRFKALGFVCFYWVIIALCNKHNWAISPQINDGIFQMISSITFIHYGQMMPLHLATMAPGHYPKQCWLIIKGILWHSPERNFTRIAQDINLLSKFENETFKLTITPLGANGLAQFGIDRHFTCHRMIRSSFIRQTDSRLFSAKPLPVQEKDQNSVIVYVTGTKQFKDFQLK